MTGGTPSPTKNTNTVTESVSKTWKDSRSNVGIRKHKKLMNGWKNTK
jgi:hypothetical protein